MKLKSLLSMIFIGMILGIVITIIASIFVVSNIPDGYFSKMLTAHRSTYIPEPIIRVRNECNWFTHTFSETTVVALFEDINYELTFNRIRGDSCRTVFYLNKRFERGGIEEVPEHSH